MTIKKIKPLFTKIVTTMDKYEEDELLGTSIIDSSKTQGTMKDIQKVVSVGSSVRDIKEGDYVKINPLRYAVRKNVPNSVRNDLMENKIIGFDIPQVEINGVIHLLVEDRDIEYIVEEYEEDKPSKIIHTEPKIILN